MDKLGKKVKQDTAAASVNLLAAAIFYSHKSHRRVQTYSPFFSRTFRRIGGRSGRICLRASSSVEKIRPHGSRIMHSSALLLNLIVTNDDDAVTTNAFVTYFPQIRKYTCWPILYFAFMVSPSFVYRTYVYYNIKKFKRKEPEIKKPPAGISLWAVKLLK